MKQDKKTKRNSPCSWMDLLERYNFSLIYKFDVMSIKFPIESSEQSSNRSKIYLLS